MKTNYPLFLLISIAFLFLTPFSSKAQETDKKLKIGLSITPFSFRNIGPLKKLDGAGSLSSKKYFSADVSVLVPLKNRVYLESGIGFSKQEVDVLGAVVDPQKERFKDTVTLKIIEVPILAHMEFGKYFYANLGPTLHFDVSGQHQVMDKQNGVGVQLAVGANLNLSQNFSVHLEPGYKIYSLIPFESGNSYDRIMQLGFKIGARYVLW